MLRIFAALFALWLANSAYAAEADDTPTDEAHLKWDAPVKNVDDTDLPECPSDHVEGTPTTPKCLDGFIFYWGLGTRDYMANLKIEDQAQRALIFADQPLDTYFFAMTAYNSGGDESAFSGEVSKTLTEPVGPLPPSFVQPGDTMVFTVVKQTDRFVLLAIGTVPTGTECDPSQSVNGHHAVPVALVVWTDPAGSRPIVVVAKCNG